MKIDHYTLMLMTLFMLLDIVIGFFLTQQSITVQSLYGITKISIFITLLSRLSFYPVYERQWKLLKNINLFYWLGMILIYIINWFIHDDFNNWLNEFNNVFLLVPVFVMALLSAIIYTMKNE